jgi:hypothetical protein
MTYGVNNIKTVQYIHSYSKLLPEDCSKLTETCWR